MHFEGEIRSLASFDSERWARREIVVKQDPATGGPQIGDVWQLVDKSEATYSVSFIKGAHRRGYSLLGQPSSLKGWFSARYPKGQVVSDRVFFQELGNSRFRLLSSAESQSA